VDDQQTWHRAIIPRRAARADLRPTHEVDDHDDQQDDDEQTDEADFHGFDPSGVTVGTPLAPRDVRVRNLR
jgi:hypothetical protein